MDSRVFAIGMVAYANGLPALLTSSTMAIWLKEFGMSYSAIGFFSLLHIPYNFKFLWAPILDSYKIPILCDLLGQRRGWLLLLQIIISIGIFALSSMNPSDDMLLFCAVSFIISISAASQHVLLLAYQVESLPSREWGVGEGMSVFGFRMAILTSGAGAIYLSTIHSWNTVYVIMGMLTCFCMAAIFFMPEPKLNRPTFSKSEMIASYKDFLNKDGWVLILIFMMIFRLPEHLLGKMVTLFYLDIGFSKEEIALVAKIFGMTATIIGGLFGGIVLREWSFRKTLMVAAIINMLSLFCYPIMIINHGNLQMLYITSAIEHFASGFGLTAFFSYQLSMAKPQYAATQLAIMTAAAAIAHRVGELSSGVIIDNLGWAGFFLIVILNAIPAILLIKFIPVFTNKNDKIFV